jgi:RNA-directed DNA polymerase
MTTTITTNKPFHIEKKRVYEAYKAVRSNRGAAGVDGQTLEQFDEDLGGNLYKIWNRMSSGSYFPPPVRAVSIPKKNGSGERILGVPTVGDRIAQMVVKQLIEADLDLSSCRTPMVTDRENRLWTPWGSHVSGAGSMIGF